MGQTFVEKRKTYPPVGSRAYAAQQLEEAVTAEYLDKLPDFISIRQLSEISGFGVRALEAAASSGALRFEKRGGLLGVVTAESIGFLRHISLLRLPAPHQDAVHGLQEVRVTPDARTELERRAAAESVSVPTLVDRLLGL